MTPRCPICLHPMTKIIPLVYSGDGAEDYTCKVVTGKECGSPVHVIVRGVIEPKTPAVIHRTTSDQMGDVLDYIEKGEAEDAGIALGQLIRETIEYSHNDFGHSDEDEVFLDNLLDGFRGELI